MSGASLLSCVGVPLKRSVLRFTSCLSLVLVEGFAQYE